MAELFYVRKRIPGFEHETKILSLRRLVCNGQASWQDRAACECVPVACSELKESMHLYLAGNNRLLSEARLGDEDCLVLAKALQNNMYVTSLDLRYNLISDKGAVHLGQMLKESIGLRELNLMCNEIGEEGAKYIAEGLHDNDTLLVLRMNGNKLGNKGGMYFAQALQVNATLESLDLGDTDLRIESVIGLSTVLYQNQAIKAMNINRPILFTEQEEPTVHWAKMLRVNTTLEELHMQKYQIRDFGAARLAESLMENFTLQYLDLSCNRITRDGMRELALVLKKNTMLKVLDLGYNRLENDGAFHLAGALANLNTNLETLCIVYNNIEGKGLCAIADALKSNSTLKQLYIWGNVLQESACIAFRALMEMGRLQLEDVDVKPYVVDDVTTLAELNHRIRRHYYWAPSYGGDVPSWQPRGENPRGGGPRLKYGESQFDISLDEVGL